MSKKSNKYAGDQPAAYDPTGISEYLGLGRPIDFDKKPVRIAMMCAVAISVVVTLWKCSTGMDSGAAVVSSLGYALSFLFSYMLALELDPDRQLGGFIGGGLTLIATYFMGEGNILVATLPVVTRYSLAPLATSSVASSTRSRPRIGPVPTSSHFLCPGVVVSMATLRLLPVSDMTGYRFTLRCASKFRLRLV